MASRIATRAFSTTARRMSEEALKKETKRNPELMVRQNSRPRQERASRRAGGESNDS